MRRFSRGLFTTAAGVALAMALLGAACSDGAGTATTAGDGSGPESTPSEEAAPPVTYEAAWSIPESLEDLSRMSDAVIVGEVVERGEALPIIDQAGTEFEETAGYYVTYQVAVQEVLAGEVAAGESIQVAKFAFTDDGAKADSPDVTVAENVSDLGAGRTVALFLVKDSIDGVYEGWSIVSSDIGVLDKSDGAFVPRSELVEAFDRVTESELRSATEATSTASDS